MLRAEWKKILRQRWFLGLLAALLVLNLTLFFYQQKTQHRDWLGSVPYYEEYFEKYAGGDGAEQFYEENMELGDYYTIYLAQEGEIPAELLEALEMEKPGILEKYQASVYANHPEELEGRMVTAGELMRQIENISTYSQFLVSVEENYESMKTNGFYDKNPYAKKVGEKTVKEYAGLNNLHLRIGMEYGINALMENNSVDALLLILTVCVCALTVIPEKNRELFGLIKSLRYGRERLVIVKFLTVTGAVFLLGALFYGSLFLTAGYLYGFGPLNRPMQSVEILRDSSRLLTVGEFLLEGYLRSTVAMVVLAWITEGLFLLMKSTLGAFGILLAGASVWIGIYETVSSLAKSAWLHFLNPVQWFARAEEYGSYQLISIWGKPVHTMQANQCLMALLVVAAFAAGIYGFCIRTSENSGRGVMLLQKTVKKISDHRPYSGRMPWAEWGKQLGKNHLFLILLFLGAAILLTMETLPANREKKEQQYHNYIETFGGPVTLQTMEAISAEEERIYQIQDEVARLWKRVEKGEIPAEQYEAASIVANSQIELLEPLGRVKAQAEELLKNGEKLGRQLTLTDELMGEYLFGQRAYDQKLGILVMLSAIVLLSGIFPAEQRNGMIHLLRAAKLGIGPLFAAKLILGMVLSVLVGAEMIVVRLLSAKNLYEFGQWQIPVQSFAQAAEIKGNLSLLEFCILTGVLELLTLGCLALVFMDLSLWMKNSLYAILTGCAVFVLPLVLGSMGVPFPWEFTGNRTFSLPGTRRLMAGVVRSFICARQF